MSGERVLSSVCVVDHSIAHRAVRDSRLCDLALYFFPSSSPTSSDGHNSQFHTFFMFSLNGSPRSTTTCLEAMLDVKPHNALRTEAGTNIVYICIYMYRQTCIPMHINTHVYTNIHAVHTYACTDRHAYLRTLTPTSTQTYMQYTMKHSSGKCSLYSDRTDFSSLRTMFWPNPLPRHPLQLTTLHSFMRK